MLVGVVSQEASLPLVTTTETTAPRNFHPLLPPSREGGSVDGSKVGRLADFEEGDDDRRFPDGWDVRVSVGEVEEVGS